MSGIGTIYIIIQGGLDMKKNKVMIGTMLLLVVLLIGGGTFAWFTAQAEPVVNEFTAGTVEIELIDCFEGAPNVNPGDCYWKAIYVKNTGTKRAYIRIKADAVFDGGQSTDVLSYGINNPINWGPFNLLPGWEYEDGYFYYNRIVHPGHYTRPLLKCNRICFNGPLMDDTYQGAELDITISAEAIQATNGAIQEEWGVNFPTIMPYSLLAEGEAPADEMLTEEDVLRIIEEEDRAFEALGLE